MSLLCYSRAAEESHSIGCKEDGVKTQRGGLDNSKQRLRPLVCLQHRLQMTASYHLTDAPSWLQSISYCRSVYTTTCAVVKPAWSNQPCLLTFLQFLLFPFSSTSLLKKKSHHNPLSTINLIDFTINSEPYGCIEDIRNQFIDVSFSLQILV